MDNKKIISAVTEWMKDDKKVRILIICGLALVLLLFLWGLFPEKKQNIPAQGSDLGAYQEALEMKTEALLKKIEGVGRISVMITLEQDYEKVYQTDQTKKSEHHSGSETEDRSEEQTEEVVLANEEALVRTNKAPRVLGVAVVCEGGNQAVVQQRVTDTVTTLFELSSARVSVVSGAQK